jgi:hypothetical protein
LASNSNSVNKGIPTKNKKLSQKNRKLNFLFPREKKNYKKKEMINFNRKIMHGKNYMEN